MFIIWVSTSRSSPCFTSHLDWEIRGNIFKEETVLKTLLRQQQCGERCHSLFLQNGFSYWGEWVPPSSSLTAHWSYTPWWSRKTCANTVITVCALPVVILTHNNWLLLKMIITTFFSSLKAFVAVSSSLDPGIVLFRIFWKICRSTKNITRCIQLVSHYNIYRCRQLTLKWIPQWYSLCTSTSILRRVILWNGRIRKEVRGSLWQMGSSSRRAKRLWKRGFSCLKRQVFAT